MLRESKKLTELVNESTHCIAEGRHADALEWLEPHKDTYEQDIGYCTLLAIAQAGTRDLKKSDKSFRELVKRFEEHPEVIFTVRDRLRPLYGTPEYAKMKKQLRGFAAFPLFGNPNLYAVDGFLCLAEHNFEQARDSFEKILADHQEKKAKYAKIMEYLRICSNTMGDMISAQGYEHVKTLFEDKAAP